MLRRLLLPFVCISLAQDSTCVRAADLTPPTAEAIFDAYLRARGGEDALNSLGAIERIGWISTFMDDGGLQAGTYHTCIRYPDRIAIEIDAGAFQLAQALRTDGAVECSRGFAACRLASREVATQLIDTARHANKDLLDKKDLWRAAAVTPSANGAAWRLATARAWAEFDRTDGHLRWLGRDRRARRLGQWRTVEGVTIPFRLEDYGVEGNDRSWSNTVQLKEVHITAKPSAWCTERFGER